MRWTTSTRWSFKKERKRVCIPAGGWMPWKFNDCSFLKVVNKNCWQKLCLTSRIYIANCAWLRTVISLNLMTQTVTTVSIEEWSEYQRGGFGDFVVNEKRACLAATYTRGQYWNAPKAELERRVLRVPKFNHSFLRKKKSYKTARFWRIPFNVHIF